MKVEVSAAKMAQVNWWPSSSWKPWDLTGVVEQPKNSVGKRQKQSPNIGLQNSSTQEQPKNSVSQKQKQSPGLQNSRMQEILELQNGLQDHVAGRCSLERALGHGAVQCDTATNKSSVAKHVEDLIRETALLELEVGYLEKHLLSLYRKQFDSQGGPPVTLDERLKPSPVMHNEIYKPNSTENPEEESDKILGAQKLLDSGIHHHRTRSSISQWPSPPKDVLAEAIEANHSLPLSMLERVENNTSNGISREEYLGSRVLNHVTVKPNQISEEMIKSISAIYCKLAEPPVPYYDYPPSPVSFSSLSDEFSRREQCDMWSLQGQNYSLLNNPYQIKGSQEFNGPCCTMFQVQKINRDPIKLREAEQELQKFMSLISQLEAVELRRMKRNEKLAFWINVHNTLAMHVFLIYGIPQSSSKRTSILLKAAYNVGGHATSIEMIQNSVLRCRLPRPGLWFQKLFSSSMKSKVPDELKAYSIGLPEPCLPFALCLGRHSDPPVRIYTAEGVFQELEVAMEIYIRTTLTIRKQQKILLPRLVEFYEKELNLFPVGLLEKVETFMPESWRKSIELCGIRKSPKNLEWIPHNFTFRYLLANDLVKLSLL